MFSLTLLCLGTQGLVVQHLKPLELGSHLKAPGSVRGSLSTMLNRLTIRENLFFKEAQRLGERLADEVASSEDTQVDDAADQMKPASKLSFGGWLQKFETAEEDGKFWEQAQEAWQLKVDQAPKVDPSDYQKKQIWANFKKEMREDVDIVCTALLESFHAPSHKQALGQKFSVYSSNDEDLQELKEQVWVGFKEFLLRAIDKVDAIKSEDDLKPLGFKYGSQIADIMEKYNETHVETDMSPSALLALSSEQHQRISDQVSAQQSESPALCGVARPVLQFSAWVYCSVVFGWTVVREDGACQVSLLIPFEAVCPPTPQLQVI